MSILRYHREKNRLIQAGQLRHEGCSHFYYLGSLYVEIGHWRYLPIIRLGVLTKEHVKVIQKRLQR